MTTREAYGDDAGGRHETAYTLKERGAAARGGDDDHGLRRAGEADGTIVMNLRAEGPGGLIGDGQSRYAPGDNDYDVVARHVGPIPPGKEVPVRAFPD